MCALRRNPQSQSRWTNCKQEICRPGNKLVLVSINLTLFGNYWFDYVHFQFVASPKCQYVLNEIVYLGWRNWQDKGIVRKALWSISIQSLLLVLTCVPFYIPIRLVRLSSCSVFKDICSYLWKFRKFYELPYSKFINHTLSYVVFLGLVFASSLQEEFGTTKSGLVWIGKFLFWKCNHGLGATNPLDI